MSSVSITPSDGSAGYDVEITDDDGTSRRVLGLASVSIAFDWIAQQRAMAIDRAQRSAMNAELT
jgi:hypothetical protein